ncbi:MAG TPA: two-component regulator propeller domain-containing protein [Verrucomicrobiae bacterium]|jgi:signal transduction histidine kinase/ligand-binding sensor domain-containing protein
MFPFLSRRFARLVVVLAWGLAGPLPRAGAGSLPSFVVRNLLVEDGLPEDSVTAVVQTDDGYMWMGTYSGLARFDGVRFTIFDSGNTPQLASGRITCLFHDKAGVLWIGHEAGELTSRDKGGHFHSEPVRVSWKGRKIFGIAADETGDLWLVNDQGMLGRVKDGAPACPQAGRREKLVGFADGFDGAVWVTRDGYASSLGHGELAPQPLDGPPEDSYVQGICPSRDGHLWVASKNMVRKWNGAGWMDEGIAAPWQDAPLTAFIETQSGLLAAGTQDKGLYVVSPSGEAVNFSRTRGLLNDWIRSLCSDREGNLWVATGGGGVAILHAGCVAAANPPDEWQGRPVLSVCPSGDGGEWIGTEGAGLYHFKDGQWSHFGVNEGLMNLFVWSVSEDSTGRVWAGTWGAGLFVKQAAKFQRAPGLDQITVPMPALQCVPGGGLWIGTEAGLLRYEGTNGTWAGPKTESVRKDVRAVARDSQGAVWMGMLGGGLDRLRDGAARHFGKADGLSSDFVQALHIDSDGALWIGTFGGGLDRFKDGRFAAITAKQGLPNNIIGCILDDGSGGFWMSSHAGIIRASKQELDLCADGKTDSIHCATFGKSDGLPTLECSTGFQPAGCKGPDGQLWFPTGKGLVSVNPKEIHVNASPPPVVIEEVRVDGHARAAAGEPLRIAPGQHRIEIDYTALSFVAPEKVRFRYQLDGMETNWEEAGTRRGADFTYLPPGDYKFHVIACNNDGVWNTTGAEFAFNLLPHFWQTPWFLVLAGGAIMASAGLGVHLDGRRRLRRKLELLERQQAVERERSRIARDIHDDLGASLTRISLLSDAVAPDQVSPPQAGEALSRIFTTSRQLVGALDEIVWAVNPRFDTLDSLASYLGNFAQDFLETAAIRCRLDMPVHLPVFPLTSEVRHNVFLAFKEALNNVLKHAAATEVKVSLALDAEALVLSVEDNGRGFSPPAAAARPSGGFGLANMSKRLAEIGGRCDIQSAPRGGAIVRFTVPVACPHN